ncbi:MAG: glycosyltransferase family 2 protein [Hyphomicrobiaceae bacterium]|nr:glycosyltransferase family 2 protein [Hyphomicrobiaceae bacterium]
MSIPAETSRDRLRPEDFIVDVPAARRAPRLRPLSLVVPVLNEARSVDLLARRIAGALETLGNPFEVIIVDDGSTDGTLAALKALNARDPRFKALSLSRNFGKEVAVAAGMRHASGAAVVIMDGDLQHPPEMIGQFVDLWDEGYDVVYGQRTDRSRNTAFERLSARAFYKLFYNLSGTELPGGAGDFRLLDRRVVDVYNTLPERARFNKGLFAWLGFRSVGVPFEVAARAHGSSRWALRRLVHFAIDGIASFTTVPLKVWSYVGVLVSGVALLYATVFLVKTMIWGVDVPGFPTLIISVLLLGGIQLISLGVIGEYLGRVYEEVKGRPLYIVADRIGLGAAVAGTEAAEPARGTAAPPAASSSR